MLTRNRTLDPANVNGHFQAHRWYPGCCNYSGLGDSIQGRVLGSAGQEFFSS